MRESDLPTADQILVNADIDMDRAYAALQEAYAAFGDAADWLRSDHRPVGSALTDEQVGDRDEMRHVIAEGKRLINLIKEAGGR